MHISILTALITTVLTSNIYYKQTVQSTSALCLDGTPSVIYVSKGIPHKILLHFESGGWCGKPTLQQTLQSCYNRSLTNLGSSKYSPQNRSFTYGILSDSQPNYFTNWTRIFLSYCDGAGHQGSRIQPIKYKNGELYFRGSNITMQRFEYLQTHYKLYSETSEVVLSGASAGGLATYFWANYLQTKLFRAKYSILADSGIFLDSINYITGKADYRQSFRQLLSLSNSEVDPPVEQCVLKYPNNKQLCMLAQNIVQYIKVDSFTVQSLYDFLSFQDILGITCATSKLSLNNCTSQQRQYIQQYHRNTTIVLSKLMKVNMRKGIWANGCVYHGYTFYSAYNSLKFRIPSNSQYSIDYSFRVWKQDEGDLWVVDEQNWPSNAGCANAVSQQILINNNNG